VPWRLALTFGLGIWSHACVASLAFLFSSSSENSIGPIIGTMAVIIVFLVLSNTPITLLRRSARTFHDVFHVWQKVMEQPVRGVRSPPTPATSGCTALVFTPPRGIFSSPKDVLS